MVRLPNQSLSIKLTDKGFSQIARLRKICRSLAIPQISYLFYRFSWVNDFHFCPGKGTQVTIHNWQMTIRSTSRFSFSSSFSFLLPLARPKIKLFYTSNSILCRCGRLHLVKNILYYFARAKYFLHRHWYTDTPQHGCRSSTRYNAACYIKPLIPTT